MKEPNIWDGIIFTYNGIKYITKFLHENIDSQTGSVTVTMEAKELNHE